MNKQDKQDKQTIDDVTVTDSAQEFRLDDYLPFQIFLISALTCRELENIYTQYGIGSNKEWRILAILHDKGRMTMTCISGLSFIDPVNVTRTVENLHRKKLCKRHYCTDDRRKVEIELSEEGHATMRRLIPALKKWSETFQQILGSEVSREFRGNFKKIFEVLTGNDKPKIN